MSLTDIMSSSGLVRFAEIALVIFVLVFLALLVRTFAPGRGAEMEEARRLPLRDDTHTLPPGTTP